MNLGIKRSIITGGKEISVETGKLAKQADGSVVVRMGDTMLLATIVSSQDAKEGVDFLPLTVVGSPFLNPIVTNEALFGAFSGDTVL